MSNLTVPSNPPGRRISQLLSAPSVEKVRGEDGSTTYHCVGTYSSLEDSDSSVANAQLKHKRGAKYGTVNSRFLVFVFSLLGGAVSIVFAIISSLSIILGDWVLLETAELLGFVALLFSAYLASAVLFEGWSCYCRKTILLNSSCVVALALVYASGELVCSLLVSVLPVLETTYLVLLGGWMLFFNAYFAQDVVHLTAFLQSKENCILVCSTVIQQAVMRLLFQAFLPATLLPLIAHSCHLAGLTLCLVVEEWLGGVSLAPRGRSTTPMYNRNSSGGSHKYSLLGQGMPVRKSTISFGKSSRSSRSSLLGLHRPSSAEPSRVLEARGMLSDLALDPVLDQTIRDRLSHINTLLGPSGITTMPIITRVRSADVPDNSSTLNRSSAVFAVATTSTGMPVMPDAPTERQRAPTRNDFPRTNIYDQKTHLPSDHRPSVPVIQRHHVGLAKVPESPLAKSVSTSDINKHGQDSSTDEGSVSTVILSPTLPESPTGEVFPNLNKKESLHSQFSHKSSVDSVTEQMRKVSVSSVNDVRTNRISGSQGKYSVFTQFKDPDPNYDIRSYSECQLDVISELGTWDFPIFRFYEEAEGRALSLIAYQVFMEMGLMETFHIPSRTFIDFFRSLEVNYGIGPYHNSRHAADVLHATFYLLTEPIPEFTHAYTEEDSRVRVDTRKAAPLSGSISAAFSVLEVFAGLLSAACHDYDHPGRTNAFLTATKNPLAVLYNDRSVLENHHAASSWELLTSETKRNFICDLDPAEYKRLRFLFIEGILATDLKMHFGMVGDFKAKYVPAGNIDWSSEEDRLTVMKMVIKMADINGPSKSIELHKLWTECITEEFYQQDEEEKRLGLPPTMFLQRDQPEKLPKVQLSFVQNLVFPLFQVCAQAGIIPGELTVEESATPPLDTPNERKWSSGAVPREPSEQRQSLGAIPRDTPGERRWSSGAVPLEKLEPMTVDSSSEDEDASPQRRFTSVILDNLQANIDMWQSALDSIEGRGGGGEETEGRLAPPPLITVEDSIEGDIEDN